jgi:NAD(P)-dependent dehydrogenase (short-subunit alcohol dehydrogenase family)
VKNLSGKVAFVTGAASGIGLGITTALANAGVKVMMCDIEDKALEKALDGFRRTNADVAGVRADVSVKADLQAAADATLARYGQVHILCNNAGVVGTRGYLNWTDGSWAWTLGVNLMAQVWGVEIFGPLIESHGEGGHIVSTSSVSGLVAKVPSPYSASKYGVVALAEGLRAELAPRGIGVSVLCPGYIRTRIADSARNLPQRFADAPPPPPSDAIAALDKMIGDSIAAGIDPFYVGELVREGIENDWPYIFTDTDFEAAIDERFRTIKQGFDRIRSRTPKRLPA